VTGSNVARVGEPRPPPWQVYLREADVLPAIDRWLLVIFAPHRLEQTIRDMQAAQDPGPVVVMPGIFTQLK